MAGDNLTPMLKQYMEIKKEYPEAILFFRMGDFYEMFFDDARTAAPILEVVLTSRNKSKDDAVPLCGVPYHAMENYAAKLLKRGFKVAVCEQVEDPALAKGIVRREVTHILTPATALEIESMAAADSGLNNYLICIFRDEANIALSSLDLAVGEFAVKSFKAANFDAFASEFYRKAPREAVVAKKDEAEFRRLLAKFPELSGMMVTVLEDADFTSLEAEQNLKSHFGLESIEGLGMQEYPAAVTAAGVLLKYLHSLRKRDLKNIGSLNFVPEEDYLILDAVSFRNLEVVTNLRTGAAKGSLLDAIDQTVTPMGRRLLKQWLSYPLIKQAAIERRLDGVEEFLTNLIGRSEVRRVLHTIADLARLNSKVSLGIAQPHHLLHLKDSLGKIPALQKEIAGFKTAIVREIVSTLDPLAGVCGLIGRAIADDPAADVSEGNVIREGFNTELDELKLVRRNAKEIIAGLEKEEKAKSSIPSLKVRYNKVFGYFIEVTNTHLKLVPPHYIRKQTLVNAERFITPELKELEDKILRAEERIVALEKRLYGEVVAEMQKYAAGLHRNAQLLGLLDVLAAGAELAQRRSYCRPQFHAGSDGVIRIEEGRHAVLEAAMTGMQRFIPNDLHISAASDQILIITGPNMGGKSTYLRQNALIVILAQAGYFVPAKKAEIGLVDRIFTRIGAADSLIEGKSTFLVEMIEAAVILNNATERSLILLDEIGRGTSTFDGLSIAWAVIEHLHVLPARPRTLFATHYHELTELAEILERVKNYHISVKEWQDSVIFLHKIVPGATDQSFGIHVAKIAGIPAAVIERAKEILLNLEKKEINRLVKERITGRIPKVPFIQKSLFPEDHELKVWDEIREKLKEIDIAHLTPLDALNILSFLKSKSGALS